MPNVVHFLYRGNWKAQLVMKMESPPDAGREIKIPKRLMSAIAALRPTIAAARRT